jgi:hypothetical protein
MGGPQNRSGRCGEDKNPMFLPGIELHPLFVQDLLIIFLSLRLCPQNLLASWFPTKRKISYKISISPHVSYVSMLHDLIITVKICKEHILWSFAVCNFFPSPVYLLSLSLSFLGLSIFIKTWETRNIYVIAVPKHNGKRQGYIYRFQSRKIENNIRLIFRKLVHMVITSRS